MPAIAATSRYVASSQIAQFPAVATQDRGFDVFRCISRFDSRKGGELLIFAAYECSGVTEAKAQERGHYSHDATAYAFHPQHQLRRPASTTTV